MFATGARQHMTKPPTMSIQRKSALRPRKDPVRRLECEIRVREGEKKKRGKRGGRRRAFFEHLGVAGEEKHVEQEVDVDGAEEEKVGDEAPELEAPEDGDGIEIHPHWRHDLRRQESPERGSSSIATSKRREIEEGTLTSRAHPAVVATESARYERVTTGICASASKAT